MSHAPTKILIIDHNHDSRELLIRALRRKFPGADMIECDEMGVAVETVATQKIAAVVLHRTYDEDAVAVVKAIRAVESSVPIIAISGIDRSEAVLAAGATGFLNIDQWLLIGTVVTNALKLGSTDTKETPGKSDS